MIKNKINVHSFENYTNYVYNMDIYNKNHMKEYEFVGETNTIMVKAAMGTGKTKNLHNLFNKFENKKIVIVSFRVTLDKEYIKNFEGFKLYQEIEMKTYDTDIYDKMVIQIDSFHKIRGNIDLLVLDEFTYTEIHLIQQAKYKEACYNTLMEYLKENDTKVIVIDALLDIYNIKWFYHLKRKINYIENTNKRFNNIKIFNYSSKIGIFIDKILEFLKENKKIIIPTNCKNFLRTLELKIRNKLPNIKLKFLDVDNSDDIDLDNWNNYDIVGYTPTIVAGISFEKNHFDKIFGYFINSSSCAEMSLQQLFRTRNINDNEIHLCIENKDSGEYYTTIEDIEKNIIERNTVSLEGVMGIKLSRVNKEIIKDSYYYMYRNVEMKINKSKKNYENVLLRLLRQQGIKDIINIEENNIEKDKSFRKEMRDTSKLCNENQINDIINSDDICDEEYGDLINKPNLTYIEKNKKKKKDFRKHFNYDKDITFDYYKKYSKKSKQFKNIKTLYTFKDDIIKYLEDKIDEKEKNKSELTYKILENVPDEITGKYLYSANPYILHSSKKEEKVLLCLDILNIIGIKNIFQNEPFKINYKILYNYIKQNEHKFRLIYKCKRFDVENIKDEKQGLKEILKYVNTKIRGMFNIYIKQINKTDQYKIEGLDFWNEDINPFYEDEDLKFDLEMASILKTINLDD